MKIINGEVFEDDENPDFGSIEFTEQCGGNKREYQLNEADADKLDLLKSAGSGSTALCIDSESLYIKQQGTWRKFGKNE